MMMEKEQNESALLILGLEVHAGGNHRMPSQGNPTKTVRYALASWGCLESFEIVCNCRGDTLVTV
jgi:hypothetical protein